MASPINMEIQLHLILMWHIGVGKYDIDATTKLNLYANV